MLNQLEHSNYIDEARGKTPADYYDFEIPSKDLFEKAEAYYGWKQYHENENSFFIRRTILGPSSHRCLVKCTDGKIRNMIMLGGNSYFELNTHPEVKQANIDAIKKYGTGAGSSALLAGTLEIHRELERKLAEFKGCEAAMVFPSGFQTNYSLINGLLRSQDGVINDILNHASIVEGCKGTQAKYGTHVDFYAHNNMKSLRRKLEIASKKCAGGILVICDGVFSMDGDIAPLPEIIKLAREYGARVAIDEAHSTGILGKTGHGTAEHFSMEGQVDLTVGTFSKSLGAVGGFIAGNKKIIDYLRMYGPGYMFSTASAPGVNAAVLKALELIEKDSSFRDQLWENTHYMHKELTRLGFDINGSQTPIIPVNVPNDKALPITFDLQKRNIFINPVMYPAVSRNRARLRISLMSTLTKDELDQSLYALESAGKKHGVI